MTDWAGWVTPSERSCSPARPSRRSGPPTVRLGSPNARCSRDSARCSSPLAAKTQRRRSSSPTAACWTTPPPKRCFSTTTTSSTSRSHSATPAPASPTYRATDSTRTRRPRANRPARPRPTPPRGPGPRPGDVCSTTARPLHRCGRHRLLASRPARPDELDLHRNATGPPHPRPPHRRPALGDLEDGQPTITRFVLLPAPPDAWRCDTTHHWRTATDH